MGRKDHPQEGQRKKRRLHPKPQTDETEALVAAASGKGRYRAASVAGIATQPGHRQQRRTGRAIRARDRGCATPLVRFPQKWLAWLCQCAQRPVIAPGVRTESLPPFRSDLSGRSCLQNAARFWRFGGRQGGFSRRACRAARAGLQLRPLHGRLRQVQLSAELGTRNTGGSQGRQAAAALHPTASSKMRIPTTATGMPL